jgi:four helix bundle protein
VSVSQQRQSPESRFAKGYEGLMVYRRAFEIALEIHHFSLKLPKIEQYALADQIRRSSKGICANIAEGHAKSHYSKPEFKRFLLMAVGSSEEVRVWLKFAKSLGYLEDQAWLKWDSEHNEISKMLNGLIRSL